MKNLRGNVAVVTGAGSGIGRAMALRFAAEGMKIVLADIETSALSETELMLRQRGAEVVAVRTDVSQGDSVEALARTTLETFGAVHIVCNNAGVAPPTGPLWERTVSDWEWVLSVNLWGVIHGIRVFVPLMLEQAAPSRVVNTASLAGFLPGPLLGVYNATKHAVVSISEDLYFELAMRRSPVRVSVLCPGAVETRIDDSERNRPPGFENRDAKDGSALTDLEGWNKRVATNSISPSQVAEALIEGICNDQFYIFTHPQYKQLIKSRMEWVIEGRNPPTRESRESRLAGLRSLRAK